MANLRETTQKLKKFDPEGSGYDYESARKAGLKPDKTGHWSTRVPSGPNRGLILKGMKHHTIGLSKEADSKLGYRWIKKNGRYYSFKSRGVGRDF